MTVRAQAAIPLKIVAVGHVDHGKSTMIGRLLYETGAFNEKAVAQLKQSSERRGMPIEWSFALDALQAERDQAVTIDTTQIRIQTNTRQVLVIDAPGHREFIKNMISGAALADAAVLVVDAIEGVREQTRQHGYLLRLLGIGQVAVAVNKMDKAASSEAHFREISAQAISYLNEIGVSTSLVIPKTSTAGKRSALLATHNCSP